MTIFADGTRIYKMEISGSLTDFTDSISIDVQIIDYESHPLITIADASVVEGSGVGSTDLTFTILASRLSDSPITVD